MMNGTRLADEGVFGHQAVAWEHGAPRASALEEAMAERLSARHAIATASPMVAFHLAYRAAGYPVGTTVLGTSFADPAVVRAAVACGHRLRYADVDERGHLVERTVREHVAVRGLPGIVVASHHAGHPCETRSLAAAAPGALLIEDALDAAGAVAADGRPIGCPRNAAMVVVGIRPLRASAPAQGAVILTDDATLAVRCRHLRDERAEHRLSELHAALGLVELGRLSGLVALRARIAARYDAALGMQPLATPVAPAPHTRSAWSAYLVRVPAWLRADLHEHLRALGIGSRRLGVLLHRHPFFGRYADVLPAELPRTERLAAETLILPTSSVLEDGDMTRLADLLAAVGTPEPRGVALAV